MDECCVQRVGFCTVIVAYEKEWLKDIAALPNFSFEFGIVCAQCTQCTTLCGPCVFIYLHSAIYYRSFESFQLFHHSIKDCLEVNTKLVVLINIVSTKKNAIILIHLSKYVSLYAHINQLSRLVIKDFHISVSALMTNCNFAD